MVVLTAETCWALNEYWIYNKISGIKLVSLYSTNVSNYMLIIVQRDATQSSLFIILQVHSTCFGCQSHPSSGVHQIVTAASCTGHIFVQLPSSNVAKLASKRCTKIWPVPEAVVTVWCTPDDGCGWHPKHVEWTCRIINRLLCVASRWTIINIVQRCTEP